MHHRPTVRVRILLSLLCAIIAFGGMGTVARAELSPDVGLEVEMIELQAKQAAEKARLEEAKQKAEAEKKLAAEKKAKAEAAAKKKKEAEALAAKKAAEEAKLVVASTSINNPAVSNNAPVGLAPTIVSEALSVNPGQTAAVTVKTLPGAACDINVFVWTKVPVKADGLENKIADENGICSWRWVVAKNTMKGSWGVNILTKKDGEVADNWTTLNVGRVH